LGAAAALTMPKLPSDTLLLLIDVQKAIDDPRWGPRNNPQAEQCIAALLAVWRGAGMPILHIRHDSLDPASPYRPGSPGHDFKAEAAPLAGERILAKQANSAFIGTGLDDLLTREGITTIVVAGVLTHNSVESTVRHAGDLGYRVIVAADACWAVDVTDLTGRTWPAEDVHQLSLAVLRGEYATIAGSAALAAAAVAPRPASWRR
jgi:nicotinamidase-related amidase